MNGRSHGGSDPDLVLPCSTSLKEIAAARFSDFEDVVRESNMLFLVETRDGVGFPESFHRKTEANHASG